MEKKIDFTIKLMSLEKNFTINFSQYSFSVEDETGMIVDGGHFGPNNRVYFTETTAYVKLFANVFEEKIVKLMKREKAAWQAIQDYQNNKY